MEKQLINLNPVKDLVRAKLIEKYNSTTFMNTTSINIQIDIKEILDEYIKEKQIIEPRVFITSDAYIKLRTLVDRTDTEIGWYGIVEQPIGLDKYYIIKDIKVYPQKVTGVTCEQDEDRMFEFEMGLTTDEVNNKRFQGHSHVNMGTTPSSTDEQYYQDLLTQVNDYFIITITNKKNEYTTRFYDIENNIMYKDVPIKVIFNDGSLVNDWYDEVLDNLSKPTSSVSKTSTKCKTDYEDILYNSYSRYYQDDYVWDKDMGYIRKSDLSRFRKHTRRKFK